MENRVDNPSGQIADLRTVEARTQQFVDSPDTGVVVLGNELHAIYDKARSALAIRPIDQVCAQYSQDFAERYRRALGQLEPEESRIIEENVGSLIEQWHVDVNDLVECLGGRVTEEMLDGAESERWKRALIITLMQYHIQSHYTALCLQAAQQMSGDEITRTIVLVKIEQDRRRGKL